MRKVVRVESDYNLADISDVSVVVLVDTSKTSVRMTLKDAAVQAGQEYFIRHHMGGHAVMLNTVKGQLIGDEVSGWASSKKGDWIHLISTGDNWLILAEHKE